MKVRGKGKFVSIDKDNPEALGVCDKTGFVFNRKDLLKQMEWRGNSLKWTGLWVGRPFLDQPNEQARPPILPPDPEPVKNPRPFQYGPVTWSTDKKIFQYDSYTFGEKIPPIPGTVAPSPQERNQELGNTWMIGPA